MSGTEHNPFLTPRSPDPWARAPVSTGEPPLATPGQRFGAAALDALGYAAAVVPGLVAIGAGGTGGEEVGVVALGLGWLGLFAAQSWLVATTGQSLGKRALRIRIVGPAGGPPGALNGVVLRSLLPALIGFLPLLGTLFGIVDGAMIFSEGRLTLHDRLASTRVVQDGVTA